MTTRAPIAGTVTAAQLCRSRVRIAWQMLSEAAEHADLLPVQARPHIARAVAELIQAKAFLEEQEV